MPWILWAVAASVLGYLAGKSASEPKASEADASASSKPTEAARNAFMSGKSAGYEDAKADFGSGRPPRVLVTKSQLQDAYDRIADWVSDPGKAYALGYNEGYVLNYESMRKAAASAPPISSPPETKPVSLEAKDSSATSMTTSATRETGSESTSETLSVSSATTEAATSPSIKIAPIAVTAPYVSARSGAVPSVAQWYSNPSFRRLTRA